MRVFAGPNGSGKTTIVKEIEKFDLGVYINADDIESLLNQNGGLNFLDFKISTSEEELQAFFQESQFSPIYRNQPDLWQFLHVKDNALTLKTNIDSYLAADLADYVRKALLQAGISFTFETVMSHAGKLDFFREAKEQGYRVYLYYISTEDPDINISRVKYRVIKNGHPVSEEAIKRRYYKSLENLREAVMLSNRAYLFDNSGQAAILKAEVTEGTDVNIIDPELVPNWLARYLLKIES